MSARSERSEPRSAVGGDAPPRVLDARIGVRLPVFRLDLPLNVGAGEIVALLGPNGAGKSTTLRALAGLQPITDGRIMLDDRVLDDPARGVFVPPERRGVGVVFQEYLLFPHLSVADNVAFGPRCHGFGRGQARRIARDWLERFGLADRADARPGELSGGQAQRVALARALAAGPRLLLLDEPLAALDAATRPAVRAQLRGYLAGHVRYPQARGPATVLVSHDPLDAAVLADRIVVVEDGRVVQEGDAADITRHPRTGYVARLAGLNLFRGTGTGTTVRLADGLVMVVAGRVEGAAFVAFPPSAVAVYRHAPDGSPRNVWPATVAGIERHGDSVRLHLAGAIETAADVTPAAAAELRLDPGERVFAAVKAAEVRAYPA